MAAIFHAVLTRFCIRNLFPGYRVDPLEPRRLQRRFELFEITCLPSLSAQTNQDFTWFVFVDESLPAAPRQQLAQLIGRRQRSVIVTHKPGHSYRTLNWLPAGLRADYVVTTIHDDDDALRMDYLEFVRAHIERVLTGDDSPALHFVGAESAVEWNLVSRSGAPLGFEKPWQRRDFVGRPYPVSTGLSLVVKYPELPLSIGQFSHAIVPNTCRVDDPRILQPEGLAERVRIARAKIREAVESSSPTWDGSLSLKRNYHACTLAGPQAVVTNHGDNIRHTRLGDAGEDARAVRPGHSFAEVPIDFGRAVEFLSRQR